MTTELAFRRSHYLTLILGSVCLGYSEWDYLPEVSMFAGIVILGIIAAFFLDRRGHHLTLQQANIAGAVIFALAALWLGYHYRRPSSLMNTLPWPAGGLPFLAPLLLLLIPAKLFRPKHVGDWWALYGISLACVGLAIALAEDAIFVLLVLLYTLAGVWSLTLFYFYRFLAPESPAPRRQARQSVLALTAAGLVAVPIFFFTPRTAGVPWELFNPKLESGLSSTSDPDLSRTGRLSLSQEVAFEVTAFTRSGPKLDLTQEQRWRGPSYAVYDTPRGLWKRGEGEPLTDTSDASHWQSTERVELPDLGPEAFMLDFELSNRVTVFADPVAFRPNARSPMAVQLQTRAVYARQLWDTSFAFTLGEYRFVRGYRQIARPADDRTPTNTFPLSDNDPARLFTPFRTPPPRGVTDFARRVLEQLRQDGLAPPGGRGTVGVQDFAAVAEAFTQHLSNGRYRYTLDLRRQDRSIDPIEDFLLNVRSGHCERFASALVLMLRGVGVPAQLVTGYRGGEPKGDGVYRIRQSDAHAWAEVLLPFGRQWYWKAFDPTPGASTDETEAGNGLLANSTKQGQKLFADYVINLNADSQQRLTDWLSAMYENYRWHMLGGVIGLFAAFVFLRRLWKRRRQPAAMAEDPNPWFTRLTTVLATLGLERQPSETPQEYAARVEPTFVENGSWQEFATLPREAANTVYLRRYAENTVDEVPLKDRITAFERVVSEKHS